MKQPEGSGAGKPGATKPDDAAAKPPATDLAVAVPIVVDIGWSMAVLFGESPDVGNPISNQLPSEHELSEDDRVTVEIVRLTCLLTQLHGCIAPNAHPLTVDAGTLTTAWTGAAPPAPAPAAPAPPPAPAPAAPPDRATQKADLRQALVTLNVELLEGLACAGHELELAYQLGRSLRDTVNPPVRARAAPRAVGAVPAPTTPAPTTPAPTTPAPTTPAPGAEVAAADRTQDLLDQLKRHRITRIQEWLATLAPYLPPDSAAVVGASLGRWSDSATAAFDLSQPGTLKASSPRDEYAGTMLDCLLPQGDMWLYLLTGDQSTKGLLTPEAYVAAGEAALNRSARIVWKVVCHYWIALALVAAALVGILVIAGLYLGGAGQVWTQIAAIASALGVTAKGIGSTVTKLAKEGGYPVYVLEEQDAMAWAVTTLPPVDLTHAGVRALRKSGITGSGPLGRV